VRLLTLACICLRIRVPELNQCLIGLAFISELEFGQRSA